jgi:hypothetical protein
MLPNPYTARVTICNLFNSSNSCYGMGRLVWIGRERTLIQ